jgi:hypothetical protein
MIEIAFLRILKNLPGAIMAKTPETTENTSQIRAEYPWLTPNRLETFADPTIFAKQF